MGARRNSSSSDTESANSIGPDSDEGESGPPIILEDVAPSEKIRPKKAKKASERPTEAADESEVIKRNIRKDQKVQVALKKKRALVGVNQAKRPKKPRRPLSEVRLLIICIRILSRAKFVYKVYTNHHIQNLNI